MQTTKLIEVNNRTFFEKDKNRCGKEQNTGYQHFSSFPTRFSIACPFFFGGGGEEGALKSAWSDKEFKSPLYVFTHKVFNSLPFFFFFGGGGGLVKNRRGLIKGSRVLCMSLPDKKKIKALKTLVWHLSREPMKEVSSLKK